jgi:plastocyanin
MLRLVPALLLALLAPAAQETSSVSGTLRAPDGAAQKRLREKIKYGANLAAIGHKDPDPSPAVLWLEGAPASAPVEAKVDMKQEGLEFRPRVLAVQVGTTIRFPNGDDLYHNVFSYSKIKRIELGRYPKGESKEEKFEARGRWDLRCEIHEHMRGYIHVFDHPYFTLAKEDGSFTIPKVPPGKYTLVAWKEFFDPVRREIEVTGDGAKVDLTLARLSDPSGSGAAGARDASCCSAR